MMRTCLELAAFTLLAASGVAQTSRGTLSGSVTDASGALVAGARVALTHTQNGVRRSTVSNEAGIYRFDAVDPGLYELQIEQAGFRRSLIAAIVVEANRTATIDVRLELGAVELQATVSADAGEVLVRDGPLRGGNFASRQVRDIPLVGLNPLSLIRSLPGVSHTLGSAINGIGGSAIQISVNGQRVRGNNYLLDGTENNDIQYTGVAQPFNIADAVQEVSAQTGNFGVEFGRAGGGVLNVVTRSGTNQLHGTVFWRYASQRFESVSNEDKRKGIPKSVFSRNVAGFTAGGPVRRNKTFLFGGFQQDNRHSTGNFPLIVPTEAAVARLRSLFPSNPRLDLYMGLLGSLRGTADAIDLALGADPATGMDRGPVQFASGSLVVPAVNDGPQGLVRLDHYRSEAHRISARYINDSRLNSPSSPIDTGVRFPGFITEEAAGNQNFLLADSYTFSSSFTNELRFSYGRLRADGPARHSARSVAAAATLPEFVIPNIAAPGLRPGVFRFADNILFQETQTMLRGRHTLRYGAEILRQFATVHPLLNTNGLVSYRDAPGYSAFANFLDDFGGPSGRIQREFADLVFHPNELRQAYFFQDTWRIVPALTLTLGVRYELFGQPGNVLRYPAFAGFEPDRYLVPNRVNVDYNNLGPAFGLAWSPSWSSGWAGKLFGDRKTVWRGGYQITYDAWSTQLIYGLASASPNGRTGQVIAPAGGRGLDKWLSRIPSEGRLPAPTDDQGFLLEKDLRNPYTERWSFGFQRHFAGGILLDTSYVGSVSHKLTTRADFNPRRLNGARLYPALGQRWVRTSEGNSAYHSLQARLERRFAHGVYFTGSYTWSRSLDSTSEGTNFANTQNTINQLTSIPVSAGGMRIDRGPSDFHRSHRLTLVFLWELPGVVKGWPRYALGGWTVSGVASFQSGAPFTVKNGLDRNNDAVATDRPDIGNAAARPGSRGFADPRCPASLLNPEEGACVTRAQVRWAHAPVGLLANASTVGRNTLYAGGTNNFDLSLFKSFSIAEGKRLELRWEALNAFNHPQFIEPPERDVLAATPGRFLNRDFTDSGIRTMWVQAKLIF
jgi:outer membrane receptor protein involved in Fe transport